MTDCLFCKIISGDVPSHKIYEDEHSLAFLDINPVNPGHTLYIPKKHHENLHETPDKILSEMAPNLKKISKAVKKGVGADAINIWMNNGKEAGQVIFHAHLHIIPRFEGDGYELWHGEEYPEGKTDDVAQKIRNNL